MRRATLFVTALFATCAVAYLVLEPGLTPAADPLSSNRPSTERAVIQADARKRAERLQPRQKQQAAAPSNGSTFRELDAALESFRGIGYGEPPTDDRDEEDAFLRQRLEEKVEALDELLLAYEAFIAESDGDWAVNGRIRRAEARAEMTDWLSEMPTPSYLEPKQAKVYGMALGRKASKQADKAREDLQAAIAQMTSRDPRRDHVDAILATLPEPASR